MAAVGVSTVGVILAYGVEETAGTKPTSYTKLTRINSIAGVNLSTEQIDASALEDKISKYIAGRQDTGGTWDIGVNLTDDTIDEWENLISDAATAKASGLSTWFQIINPGLSKAFFVVAEPPAEIPMPNVDQNGLLVGTMSCTINEYKGLDTKVNPTA